jgi:PleD family two-component response regulator
MWMIGNEEKRMPQQRGLLLLVDGDTHRAERLAHRLKSTELEIRIATDGASGLLTAHERRPDVVVAAAETPILDGYRMLDALRSQPQTCDIPIILITEGNSPGELARGWNSGADLCIPRIQGEADVLATLHRALSGLRQWESLPRESALIS